LGFGTNYFFTVWGCQPHAKPPTSRTRVSIFVWVIPLDLSGMGGPTSSICYRQHSSRVHVTTQAPPLRQSRDTFGGQVISRKPNIVTTIEERTLEWAGHLLREPDDRTVEKVFRGKPGGRRKAGRPKLRWIDCNKNDLK
jgi:hypothetical protein